jgi:hypothetical protein
MRHKWHGRKGYLKIHVAVDKLVHSDIVTTGETPVNYEPQNTVLVDDSSELV